MRKEKVVLSLMPGSFSDPASSGIWFKNTLLLPQRVKSTRIQASLSSIYWRDCFVASLLATLAQPFSRFFHHTAFAIPREEKMETLAPSLHKLTSL
jgi:hypothetical protein